jgi:hypothetical protein
MEVFWHGLEEVFWHGPEGSISNLVNTETPLASFLVSTFIKALK